MTRRRALRCARPTGFAALRARRDSTAHVNQGSSTHTNNQRGVGPVQGSAVGPVQVAVSNGFTSWPPPVAEFIALNLPPEAT